MIKVLVLALALAGCASQVATVKRDACPSMVEACTVVHAVCEEPDGPAPAEE